MIKLLAAKASLRQAVKQKIWARPSSRVWGLGNEGMLPEGMMDRTDANFPSSRGGSSGGSQGPQPSPASLRWWTHSYQRSLRKVLL